MYDHFEYSLIVKIVFVHLFISVCRMMNVLVRAYLCPYILYTVPVAVYVAIYYYMYLYLSFYYLSLLFSRYGFIGVDYNSARVACEQLIQCR